MARRGRLLPDLGISAPSVVACILVWARDETDFRPSINGGATVPLAAQRLRACWRAMAHRRRRFALLAIPLTPMLAHMWTRSERRDRFSTIEKRRCDCAGGRAKAASVLPSDGAPAQAVCRLPRFGKLALQLAPVACTHECNSHLSTFMRSETVRDSSSRRTVSMDSLGGLPVNGEHVPHAVCTHAPDRARPPRATNLDPWH